LRTKERDANISEKVLGHFEIITKRRVELEVNGFDKGPIV